MLKNAITLVEPVRISSQDNGKPPFTDGKLFLGCAVKPGAETSTTVVIEAENLEDAGSTFALWLEVHEMESLDLSGEG